MPKDFKSYLTESTKTWNFRIKIAGDFTAEQQSTMKALLEKFQVSAFKKVGTTPIQHLPLDFPKIKNAQVNIYEVTLDYPATQWELHEYLTHAMGITKDAMVVRNPMEDLEKYQEPHEPSKEPLLLDPNYKEAGNHKFEDYYGDKYNTGLLKELNDLLKLQRQVRGEHIPKTDKVHYNTDDETNVDSILTQSRKVKKS